MRIIPFILVACLLLACAEEAEQEGSGQDAVNTTAAEVESRDLTESFTVSSDVVAYKRTYVAARISAQIEAIHFEEGDSVSRGDPLADLDVRRQEVNLRRANVALEEARDTFERNEELLKSNSISDAEFRTSERALEQALSDVEQLELEIEYGLVKAPISGVVTSRLVEPGNTVSQNERLFTVADLDKLVIRPGLSELNLAGLEKGQSVEIKLDVYPDRIFEGTIRRVFPSVDPDSGLFTTEIEIHQEDDKPVIRPGYLARITFTTDTREDRLTVPSESVIERNGDTHLFVLNDDMDSVELVPVTIGTRRDGFVEILDGIEAGQKVAASNVDAMEDGSPVRVVGSFRRFGFRD